MSIDVRLNANPGELGGTNKSAWVQLTDAAGTPLAANDGAIDVTAALPVAGVRGNRVRHLRVGHRGGVALNRVSPPLFQETGDGAAINTQMWAQVTTTHTATLANRVTTLNAGNSVAITTGITHRSLARFTKNREGLLRLSARVRFLWQASGSEMQIGFGTETSATVAALIEGIALRISPAGAITLAFYQASTINTESAIIATMLDAAGTVSPSTYYELDLYVGDDYAAVVLSNPSGSEVYETELPFAPGQGVQSALRALPVIIRTVNTAATSLVNQLLYTTVDVVTQDSDVTLDYLASLGLRGRNILVSPAGTPTQLANYVNNTAPGNATLSNTTAGYTTAGGQYAFAAIVGAETDYALFAYTVPVGYRAIITGIRISAFVAGAAIATTATVLQWSVGKAAAVTLATNSFRSTLGVQSFAIGSAIGTAAPDLVHSFRSPIAVESGQIFHVILRMPVATATASQTIRGVIFLEGVLE